MTETGYQRVAREKGHAKPPEPNATGSSGKSVAVGHWRCGSHKTAYRERAVRRIDGFDRDDLGGSPDY